MFVYIVYDIYDGRVQHVFSNEEKAKIYIQENNNEYFYAKHEVE